MTSLLIRRWPERRAVVLATAAAAFAVFLAVPAPGLLYMLPVLLVALELGLLGGAAAAAVATALLFLGPPTDAPLAQALAFAAAGAVAGRFSDRMRDAHEREQRLLDSGLALARTTAIGAVPRLVADAALRVPGAVAAAVQLDGAGEASAGGGTGRRSTVPIVVRGTCLGRIEVVHARGPAPEDRAALELLALQAGVAADNQRLLAREREAAALEDQLRRLRDDLFEERSGLGHLLDAEEDQRRRAADRLHEELAQVLAAVLLGLRMLRREAAGDGAVPLDELHRQLVGVLDDVRDVASTLRPSSLSELGLVPALEMLARTTRDHGGADVVLVATEVAGPLPEPLRTALYRLVEQLLVASSAEARGRLRLVERRGSLEIAAALPLARRRETLAAVRARVALLGGTLRREQSRGPLTRIRIRLPLGYPEAAAAGRRSADITARTTVRPALESISS